MNKLLAGAAAVLIGAVSAAPLLAADIGVSINMGEPGFYGRLDIGDSPRPQVIYQRPMVIERIPRGEVREPLYLHVPPGHERHWSQHCAQYNACGQPVYFVSDRWYRDTYATHYRERRHGKDHHGHGHDHDHD
jgi:hypothetical protein